MLSSQCDNNTPTQSSVCPYPSINIELKLILIKSTISVDIGAEPVNIKRILPPNTTRNLCEQFSSCETPLTSVQSLCVLYVA